MVDVVLIEKILGDIKSNVSDLRQATDITWEIYRTDKRSRRKSPQAVQATLAIIEPFAKIRQLAIKKHSGAIDC
ncbi:MAG: hypothetical protein ABIJ52_06355 [Pseudomonadota bacterium]